MGPSDGGSVNIDTGAVTSRLLALSDPFDKRILVVEDDDLELSLICDRLRGRDFQVAQAANGQEALEVLAHQWFPVVITSIPSSNNSSAICGVIPKPPAAFSPLAMVNSTACCFCNSWRRS